MPEIGDAAISFEAVKASIRQNKDGVLLVLVIHPTDIPEQLFRDWVGSRYMVAMVKLDDEDQPVVPAAKTDADRALAIAGALARDPDFAVFVEKSGSDGSSEEKVLEFIRNWCGIASRKEFSVNAEAVKRMFHLRDIYADESK